MLKSFLFKLSVYTIGYLYATGKIATAQVTTDGTTNTTVNSDSNGNFTIEQGDRAGSNLFHSFGEFSVPTDGSAFFNNAADISNIFSRVTGGNISNIDGSIRANGSANLFLINPAGILFGENARLDIGGSFYGSTADSILFPDGVEFIASDASARPILTINAPIGLNFRDNVGDIVNRSVSNGMGLSVNPDKTLALVGGNLRFEGGLITAPQARVELGSVGSNSSVSFAPTSQGLQLGYATVDNFQDVELSQEATIATSDLGTAPPFRSRATGDGPILADRETNGTKGGDITIQGKDITITPGTSVIATGGSTGGNITLQGETINISQGSQASKPSLATTGGIRGGDITVRGENINISQGSTQIVPFNNNIDTIDSDSLSNVPGGAIVIEGKQINLTEGVRITSESWNFSGDFDASNIDRSVGNILIGANTDNNDIVISNRASIVTDTHGFHNENDIPASAGDIIIGNINSESISIESGSEIAAESHSHLQSETNGQPRTGGARNDFDAGDAGSITIRGQRVTIRGDKTNITATAFGKGRGGDISIDGTQFVRIADGANVVAETAGATESAMAGDIFIGHNHDSNEITINNARVSVTAGETIADSHGNDPEFGFANAGDIFIGSFISEISLLNEAVVSGSSVRGTGSPGSLFVNSSFLNFDNASLSVQTPSGNRGNINIQVDRTLELRNGSTISAQAREAADGGNINIDAQFIVAFPNQNNDIIANAQDGTGGNIDITAEAIFGLEERNSTPTNTTNDIDASSEFGLDGNVSIFSPDVDSRRATAELPENVIQPEQTIAQACQYNRQVAAKNVFTIKGRGGIAPEPGSFLSSQNIYVDGETDSASAIPEPIETSKGKIQPARGIKVTEDGQIILTAYRTNNAGERLFNKNNCGV